MRIILKNKAKKTYIALNLKRMNNHRKTMHMSLTILRKICNK